jgi:hypothetical protein
LTLDVFDVRGSSFLRATVHQVVALKSYRLNVWIEPGECGTTCELDDETDLSFRAAVSHPANGQVEFVISTSGEPAGREMNISVYDVHGRLVGQVNGRDTAASQQSIRWTAIDRHGLRLPSGVYFAQLAAGSKRLATKFVLMH